MEKGINPIFPLPIFIDQAEGSEYESIQKELTTVKSKLKFNDRGSHMILNDDPFRSHFLSQYKCSHTLNLINNSIKSYINSVTPNLKFVQSIYGEDTIQSQWVIIESWMTKTIKGRCAREHSHGQADISGVYYFDTNGSDGNLIFVNSYKHLESNMLLNELVNKDTVMPLENGLIFLWPGQLNHYTFMNKTDHERISVSFNISLTRKGFGIPTSLN